VTTHGTFKGGYYPIKFDSRFSIRQEVLDQFAQVQDLFGGNWAKATTKQGHLKERKNSGGKAVTLNLSPLTEHLTNVVHDLSHRKALIDVSRLTSRREIREVIQKAAGKEMYKMIRPWLRTIAGEKRVDPQTFIERLAARARTGATIVNMGLKATTGLVQFMGYAVSAKELGVEYSYKGLKTAYGNPLKIKEQFDFAAQRSLFMKNRRSNYDRDVHDSLKKLRVAGQFSGTLAFLKTKSDDFRRFWFYHIGMMDMGVSLPTWMGAYSKAMDGNVEGLEGGNENKAVDFADKMVRLTQGSGSPKDLAFIQTGPETIRLFTMFYSFFSVLFNQFRRTHQEFQLYGDKSKLASGLLLLWIMPSVLEEILLGRGPDPDDDREEWARWMAKQVAGYPFQTVVGVRDLINGMDKWGYSPSAAFDVPKQIARTGRAGVLLLTGDKDEITRSDVKSFIMTTGYLTGLPSRQLWLTGEYFYDWMNGDESPDNPVEALWRGFVTGKKKK